MDQKPPPVEPGREITESDVVRWVCYSGFTVCLLWLIIGISTGGSFWAPLVGTVVLGAYVGPMYVREHQAEQDRATVREAQARRGAAGNTDRWNVDDQSDPTVPPTAPPPKILEP